MILAEELDEVLMFIDIRVSKNTNQVRANWRRGNVPNRRI